MWEAVLRCHGAHPYGGLGRLGETGCVDGGQGIAKLDWKRAGPRPLDEAEEPRGFWWY
jgi:hypothetical protein